jgi:hypothetical protein
MRQSKTVTDAFLALLAAPPEDLDGALDGAALRRDYLAWGSFPRIPHGRPSLHHVAEDIRSTDEEAAGNGETCWMLPDDGDGCHLLLAPDHLTEEELAAGLDALRRTVGG